MFYSAKPHIFEKAKALRNSMTNSELTLWEKLKGKQVLGLRFRPQHPIDIFIADFYCHPIKLLIEVDGGIHKTTEQKEYDIGRTAELNYWGIEVIRFTNEEVEINIDSVVDKITKICQTRLSEIQKKSPLGVAECWQSWRAATRNPVEALRYE
jgi:very-short-patch-repair endonuclease